MKRPAADVLQRYFEHRGTTEEAEAVIRWLATSDGQKFYERYLEQQIQRSPTFQLLGVRLDEEQALRKTYARIARREKAKQRRRWLGWAAACVLLIVGGWLTDSLSDATQVVQTAFGETRHITLEDGTQVVLNANSTLRYDREDLREVWLDGEAYFRVTHTIEHDTFRVHTADLAVNVLGTAFNVHTRHEATSVVLNEGKVTLELTQSDDIGPLGMEPGERVSFSQKTKSLEKDYVDPQNYTAWTEGAILFDHTSLREIATLLEDTYGVRVVVADPQLLKKELSGQVDLQLNIIITLLEKSFGLEITRQEDTIFIR